mmetsp:Transcript_24379/g.51081  ORF Transcript_24379/g.51081 Transcript_24379/m.51081 type:complete len:215 (+) Transcript_24379:33-677(+)
MDQFAQVCDENKISCTLEPVSSPKAVVIDSDEIVTTAEDLPTTHQGDVNEPIIQPSKSSSNSSSKRNKKQKQKEETSSIIRTLHNQQDVDAFLSTNDAVIIEFMTTWCGACKSIEEYYCDLSVVSNNNDKDNDSGDVVRTARVICDKNKQTKKVAASYHVKSYPVFVAFKDGVVFNRFDGADRGKLEAAFERLGGGGSSGSGGKKKKRGGRSKR